MKYRKQNKQLHNIINSLYYPRKTETILNYKRYLQLDRRLESTSVTQKRVQVRVNSTGYCSSIYRHRTQPVRNYIHALYIYY